MSDPSSDSVALDGRALGRRGTETRQRLLDATATLLEDNGLRELRVADIARAVQVSPATFYQYFRDVEAAVLALSARVGEETASLTGLLAEDWDGPDGLDRARRLVEEFIANWDQHRAVLRTRNLAAQEGDDRFRAVRNDALRPLTEGIAAKVAARTETGLAPYAAAAAMVSMLERMAAFHTDLTAYGTSRAEVVETSARILHHTATGSTVR
ncbi:MAG: TetR/AcrR family transcriptional regulator [Acidimicrobiia bacterium]|nr:TetR/AcrR family transcriptional regulator [Acidimicrobiia bacterium]